MLSCCGTDSVPSWHPQADDSLHSIVCTHFALSKSLFKQFWGSKKCFISFSVLCIFVFEEKQRTIISVSFNSCFTDKPLFISQLSVQFYSKTVREVKFSLHKIAIKIKLNNACLKHKLLFLRINKAVEDCYVNPSSAVLYGSQILFFVYYLESTNYFIKQIIWSWFFPQN